MLVVDAANVVGSRPNGWWRDRGKAAENLCRELADAMDAGRLEPPVVVVLEGGARRGIGEHEQSGLQVLHAPRSGDDTIAELVTQAAGDKRTITVITADRALAGRARRVGCAVVGPRWLLDRL
jgi:hypothetical protein